jgi:hypothetical protein
VATGLPVIEHREGRTTRWLHERRTRAALLIGFVESLLVIFAGLGWFWVVGAAVLALAVYSVVRGRWERGIVREASWILAASQLIAVVVPVLWELVKAVAIVVLVLMGILLLALLLRER